MKRPTCTSLPAPLFTRRSFLTASTAAFVGASAGSGLRAQSNSVTVSNNLYVSTDGDDGNPGTLEQPLRTFRAAQMAVRTLRRTWRGAIGFYFRQGTYYLDETIVFTPDDSGEQQAPTIYSSYPGERAVLSGGSRLTPQWRPYKNGIMETVVPSGTHTDQIIRGWQTSGFSATS